MSIASDRIGFSLSLSIINSGYYNTRHTFMFKGAVRRYCLLWEAVQARMISQPVKSLK